MGHQVRDCLHARDLAPLVLKQMAVGSDATKPAVVNVSGGSASAMSLRQLSEWCVKRWGEKEVMSDVRPRRFDLPWVVLDRSLASYVWDWQPITSLELILEEVSNFADRNPNWIATSV